LKLNTHADDRGGLKPVLTNAMKITGCPPVNVHAFNMKKAVTNCILEQVLFSFLGLLLLKQK
jgi:hypothetical protein